MSNVEIVSIDGNCMDDAVKNLPASRVAQNVHSKVPLHVQGNICEHIAEELSVSVMQSRNGI